MSDIILRSDLPVHYIDHMGNDSYGAKAAWGDWDREFKSVDHATGFLDKIIGEKHGSPVEFTGELIVYVEMPLFTVDQVLRHRTLSFAGWSARYHQMIGAFYLPDRSRPTVNVATKMNPRMDHLPEVQWLSAQENRRQTYQHCWDAYQTSLSLGEAEEVARMVLPEATYTSYSLKTDVRNWLGFLQLRVDSPLNQFPTHPQWEIQEIARQVESIMDDFWPQTMEAFRTHGRVKP